MSLIGALVHRFGRFYITEICRREFESEHAGPVAINERPVEYRFVFEQLLRTAPTSVLDVGTGMTALPHLLQTCGYHVTAIDNVRDFGEQGTFNRHFYVIHDDITNPSRVTSKFDFITCISVLEHIPAHEDAVNAMLERLETGGHLAMTFPYNESQYVNNVYELPAAAYGKDKPYVCQVYSRSELSRWLAKTDSQLVQQEYWQMFTGEFWTMGERLAVPKQVTQHDRHHLSCVLIRKATRAAAL